MPLLHPIVYVRSFQKHCIGWTSYHCMFCQSKILNCLGRNEDAKIQLVSIMGLQVDVLHLLLPILHQTFFFQPLALGIHYNYFSVLSSYFAVLLVEEIQNIDSRTSYVETHFNFSSFSNFHLRRLQAYHIGPFFLKKQTLVFALLPLVGMTNTSFYLCFCQLIEIMAYVLIHHQVIVNTDFFKRLFSQYQNDGSFWTKKSAIELYFMYLQETKLSWIY